MMAQRDSPRRNTDASSPLPSFFFLPPLTPPLRTTSEATSTAPSRPQHTPFSSSCHVGRIPPTSRHATWVVSRDLGTVCRQPVVRSTRYDGAEGHGRGGPHQGHRGPLQEEQGCVTIYVQVVVDDEHNSAWEGSRQHKEVDEEQGLAVIIMSELV